MAKHNVFLKNAMTKYTNPDIAMNDITNAIHHFPTLRPSMDLDCTGGRSERVVSLKGTIPVTYLGCVYNIPVALWLGNSYPRCPPKVYVTPTANIQLKPGRHVVSSGKAYLPYIYKWRQPHSHILGLVRDMCLQFWSDAPSFLKYYTIHIDIKSFRTFISKRQKLTKHRVFLEVALTKYKHPDIAMDEITNATNHFSDLRPSMDRFDAKDGRSTNLLCLKGTIPVSYQGCLYNIPVTLWLRDSYPRCPPAVLVAPSAAMQINPGHHVDSTGKVHLPYLSQWSHPPSHMIGLIEEMCTKFGEKTPVYSTTAEKSSTSNLVVASSQSELTKKSHESDIEELRNKLMCKIFLDHDACVLFDDCSHMACCETCARSVSKCPICRSTISNRRRVFTA